MAEYFLSALHSDPWNEQLLDLPELNAEASDAVARCVHAQKERAGSSPDLLRTESMVFLGPPGVGKTHLFSRLRKKLGPHAVFVHLRPLLHAALTPAFVLDHAVVQLANASYGHSQADALVGSILAHINQGNVAFPSAALNLMRDRPESERAARLEAAVDKVLEIFPDADDVFVERLLQLPFCSPRVRRALLAWLSGQDCDPSQLQRIGAAASMPAENAVRALRTLGSVSALGSPMVLVFDQLENLVQKNREEQGITQYGNLIAELVDATRGFLVVQMALDSEWEQAIEPRLNLSQRSRVVMTKRSIALPTMAQNRELLELWHQQLEAPEGPLPWPFGAAAMEELLSLPGMTPRMLLSALREAREGVPVGLLQDSASADSVQHDPSGGAAADTAGDLDELLQEDWQGRLVAAHHALDQAEARRGALDRARLCDGILTAAQFVDGLQLLGSTDAHIQMEATPDAGPFVAVLHQAHHKSLGAALRRVLARPPTAPGVLVREQWRPLPPTWKGTIAQQLEILARPNIAWFELQREDAVQLFGLEELVQASRSQDICDSFGRPVSEQAVRQFIATQLHPERWPLLAALRQPGAPVSEAQELEELKAQAEGLDSVPAVVTQEAGGGEELDAATALGSESEQSPGATAGGDAASAAATGGLSRDLLAILARLRVASVDRVIREARRTNPGLGRTAVLAALEQLGVAVVWHGRQIVAMEAD